MKRIVALLATILLLGCLLLPSVSAAGSLSASASSTSVTVGQTVTVTLKYSGGGAGIGGLIGSFKYNASLFTYTGFSGTSGLDASGSAGVVRYVYAATGATAPTEMSITITLKAAATGTDTFAVSTEEFFNDSDYSSLGSPSKEITVSVTDPVQSGDATLSYLKPTKGTLTPKFDKNVTEYTVSVPYTVTRGLLNFTASDAGAKTAITNNADLQVGNTVRVITVTAPNGTVKKYTVTFIRAAQEEGDDTSTLPTTPVEGAPVVEVGGVMMDVAENQPAVDLPAGFVWDYTAIGERDVVAAKQENGSMTLVYLTEQGTENSGFYIYDAEQDTFTLFRQVSGAGVVYVLHELPDSETAPVGTVLGAITIGEQTVSAYTYEDPTLADYAVVYLTAPDGTSGYYTYDAADGSLQRYHAVTIEASPEIVPEPPVEKHPIVAFIETYQMVILVGAAACAGLALLIVVIVWIAGQANNSKGKH